MMAPSLARGTKIWHFSHVMPGAVIGERCNLGQNVVVMPGARLGNNVKVQNNVSIYEGVVLEDDVFCGPSCVFTNVGQSAESRLPQGRVSADPGAPGYLDWSQCHDSLWRHPWGIQLHRRRGRRSERRTAVRPDGGGAG